MKFSWSAPHSRHSAGLSTFALLLLLLRELGRKGSKILSSATGIMTNSLCDGCRQVRMALPERGSRRS